MQSNISLEINAGFHNSMQNTNMSTLFNARTKAYIQILRSYINTLQHRGNPMDSQNLFYQKQKPYSVHRHLVDNRLRINYVEKHFRNIVTTTVLFLVASVWIVPLELI